MKWAVLILLSVASTAAAQQTAVVIGSIQDVKQFPVSGQNDKHQFAKIRTQNGNVTIVDLGSNRELQDVTIKPNQNIAVLGLPGQINGKPMIVAERIRFQNSGLTLILDRGLTQPEAQQASATQGPAVQNQVADGALPSEQTQSVSGRVLSVRRSNVRGQDHQIVEIETTGGVVVADIGSFDEQRPVRTGERLSLKGKMGVVNDQAMVIADRSSIQEQRDGAP